MGDRAKLNQVFVCAACGRTFLDRAATDPVEVTAETYERVVRKPHPKYPNDPDLATDDREHVEAELTMPASPAQDCCPTHTALSDSRHMVLQTALDGTISVCRAKRLE